MLVSVAALSLTVVNGQSLARAVGNAALVALAVAAGLVVLGPFVGGRSLGVAVHAALGLFMTGTGALVAALLYAESAISASLETAIVGGILPVGLAVLVAGGLLALGETRTLRRVALLGLVLTAGWGLVSLAAVVLLTYEAADPAPALTGEAVGIWVLFLSFLLLPGAVFLLDRLETRD